MIRFYVSYPDYFKLSKIALCHSANQYLSFTFINLLAGFEYDKYNNFPCVSVVVSDTALANELALYFGENEIDFRSEVIKK